MFSNIKVEKVVIKPTGDKTNDTSLRQAIAYALINRIDVDFTSNEMVLQIDHQKVAGFVFNNLSENPND